MQRILNESLSHNSIVVQVCVLFVQSPCTAHQLPVCSAGGASGSLYVSAHALCGAKVLGAQAGLGAVTVYCLLQ
jgi:hypothetical protein